MHYSTSTSMNSIVKYSRWLAVLFLLFLSTVASADPTGNFRYPSSDHSFNGNLLFSVRIDDPDGLGRVVIRFNNSSASELLVCNCGDDTSESFTDAGIKPRDLNLGIGTHTAQLITNNGGERIVDTLRFSWNPPEIGGVEVERIFGSFTINWSSLPGYSVYNLYIASEPNISPDNADGLPDSVTFRSIRGTSQTITDIDDELGLFGLVTGTDTSGESAFSQVFRIEALDNQDPVVQPESFTLAEDGTVNGNVLTNDLDPENQPLTAELVSQPLNGSVELSEDGAFSYEPNDNFNGSDDFSYTANDPQGGSQVGVVALTVTPVNDAPAAINDSYQTNEDTALSIDAQSGVLTNDNDIDGDALDASIISEPQNGLLSLNALGSFVYEPAQQFFGTDTFTYQVSDGNGGSAEALVTIEVASVNDLPTANNDTYETNEDETLTVSDVSTGLLANDSDADFDDQEKFNQLSVALLTQPDSGELNLASNGTFTYTPVLNFFGAVSFTYQVSDPEGETATAGVIINVVDTPDLPIAQDDTYSVEEDAQLVVSAADGVLANDRDGGGTELSASLLSEPQSGVLLLNSDGSFSYQASENFNGTDSFTYLATNEPGQTAQASVTLTITPVNDAPVAVDDVFIVDESASGEITPLDNDTDIDSSDTLRIVAASAESGTLTFTDSSISYTAPNAPGSDIITYSIADSGDLQASASIAITINDVEQAPIAVDDTASTEEDTPVSLTPLDNDSDPDGDELTLSADSASNGNITVEGDTLTFTPEENFNGAATATYFVSDPAGNMTTGTISIDVTPVNDAPVAVDDEAFVAETQSVTIDPRGNDTDVDGDALTITAAQSLSGEVSFTNTDITYVAPAQPGDAIITYTISDPDGATASASVLVTINNIDDAPVTQDDEATVDEDSSVTISPLSNDSDPDGDTLTVSVVAATNGTANADSDSSITFTPESNYNGPASVSYLATDPGGNSASGNINITVNAINDAPVAADDQITVAESSTTELSPLSNDTDIDEGDVISITSASASNGSLTFTDSSITYTAPDTPGQATLSYTISDTGGETSSATINVEVSNVQDAPVTINDAAITEEDTSVEIAPLLNDDDEDGDTLTVSIVSISSGTATLDDNIITYTPEENFNGTATIVYTATDIAGNNSSSNITITVQPVNDAPVALDDTASTTEDNAVQISPLSNDSDVENDALTISIINVSSGVALVDDDVVTYTPDSNFNGTATITYQIADPSGATASATITVSITAVNDTPVATDDSVTTTEDTEVQISPLSNDSDADNDALTITILSTSSGSASVNGDVVTYTPATDVNGTATINYQIIDPAGATATATITVTITAINDAPVAQNDNASTNEDTPVDIKPLDNDSDIENDALTLTINSVTNGSTQSPASDTITFTPDADYNGGATIQYSISDGQGGSASATISIDVIAVNDAPVTVADTATVNEGDSVNITPLSNDSDIDGDSLTITGATVTTGNVVVNSDATTLTYTAPTGFAGTATITYTVTDTTESVTGTVTVTVGDVNFAPVAVDDSYSVSAGETETLSVLSNDTDSDNDALSITQANATQGSVTISSDASSLSYTAPADTTTTDTVSYTISDPSGATSTATATISVTEQSFSGDFDSDGDGNSDVTASSDGTDYTVTFGDSVDAVYYEDNGEFVSVSTNDSGTYELVIEGTAASNTPASQFSVSLITDATVKRDFTLPSSTNTVFYTIDGVEYSFTVSKLDQPNANVAFGPPGKLDTDFKSKTSHDFYTRFQSFTGPLRFGVDNGEHYILQNDGSGSVRGSEFDYGVTWLEIDGNIQVDYQGSNETLQSVSVYELDDDASDGIALGVITKAEADAHISANGNEVIDVYTRDGREIIRLLNDNRVFVEAEAVRFSVYRINPNTYPQITSAQNGVLASQSDEKLTLQLWNIDSLKVQPIAFNDLQSGIATDIPRITNNAFERFVADICTFSLATNNGSTGSGSCQFSSQSFTWSINTGNVLRLDFGNNVVADYRWLDALAVENTFSVELTTGTTAAQSKYSTHVYWLPRESISDSSITSTVNNNYFSSSFTKTNPDARGSDKSINDSSVSGFYFASNGQAKNLTGGTEFNLPVIKDTDRKWNLSGGLITLQSLSSKSSGNTFSYDYDLCTDSNDAICFVWQFRELYPITIDGNKIWVWETVQRNQTGATFNTNIDYSESVTPRLQFYELTTPVPGEPNSTDFNQEPIAQDISLQTDLGVPLNNIDLSSYFSDPESDAITIAKVAVDTGTGTVSLNQDQSISYTPASSFTGDTKLFLEVSDGINRIFPVGKINVKSTNVAPVANNDTATATSGFATLINPLSNDTDNNNDTLTITAVEQSTGAASISNGTQIEFTPPNTFSGAATINYTISDGRGGTASATVTVTVSKPAFSGAYDLDNSSVADFTITNKGGTFEVSFSSEVDAVYYTLNGQRLLLSKNAIGRYTFDYPANINPIPVLTYVINGVEYSFGPDDLSLNPPNLVFNGFVNTVNDFGTLSSYQLISRVTTHNSALNTGFENGVLYDLLQGGTGSYNGNLFTDTVTWSNGNNKITVNLDNPFIGSATFNVYDLDDEANGDLALGVYTKADADAHVAATGQDFVTVFIDTLGYELTATQKNGYYYDVNRSYIQDFTVPSFSSPVLATSSPVRVSVPDIPQQLLSTAEFNFNPVTAADIVGTIHVPVPLVDNADVFEGFASNTCTLTESSAGSNTGTGTCGTDNSPLTWSIQNDGSVAATFGTQANVVYRWLNKNDVENTFFVKVTDSSNSTTATLDYWLKSQTISSSQVSAILLQDSYLERDDFISNPLNYTLPGIPTSFTSNGVYVGGAGLAKNIQEFTSTINAVQSQVFDLDLHWSVDNSGIARFAAQSNMASSDTFKYLYSQCSNSNDQNCYQWDVRSWEPLAIDGNRIWVMETTEQDPDQGQYNASDTLQVQGDPTIRFYEVINVIPGGTNSTSFNQEPLVLDTTPFSAQAGIINNLDVLSVIGDPESDLLTIQDVTGNGTVTISNNNTVNFTPTSTFVGQTALSLTISDGTNLVVLLVIVNVSAANQAPVAVDDTLGVIGSHNYSLNVLANDSDADNDTLTITTLSNFTDFQIGNSGTTIEYTAPAVTSSSNASVVYTISDGNNGSDSATLTLNIDPNSNPVAVNDTAGPVNTGNTITITPLDNDTDVDGDFLLISSVNSSNVGTNVISGDNRSFNLTPSVGAGVYTISYIISDGFGGTATANIDVTVTTANTPPVANDDTFIASRTLLNFISPLTNDTDVDSDSLSITSASSTNGGTALISNGNQSIDYNAPSSGNSDTINYSISDGNGGTANAVINVTINDAPIANPDIGAVIAGNTVTLHPLANDTDANSDTLTISAASSNDGSVIVAANKLSLDFTPSISSGSATIDYTADDSNGGTASSTITVTVTTSNNPPVANNDSVTVAPLGFINIDVLANDTDPDSDPLTMVSASANNGSASLSSDNLSVDYNAPSTDRSDIINYTIQDINGAQASAQVSVVVNTNPAATASNETISTSSMATYTPTVTDADGDTITVSAASVTSGLGSVTFSGGDVTYTSTATEGTSVISYTIQDGFGGTASSTITVTVNSAPTVTGETYTLVADSATAVVIDAAGGVLANDSDPTSETLTVSLLSAPGHSSAFTLNPDGSFSYRHDGSNILTDGFSYNVTEGSHTINGYANINLVKENFKPEFCTTPPSYLRAGETYSVTLGVNDKDGDSQTIAVATNETIPTFMSLTGNTLTMTPGFGDVGSTNTVNLTTTDGIDSDTLTFDVVVYDAFSQNNFEEFDLGGTVETVEDVAIDNYGNIIVVGQADGDLAVAKLLPTGSVDPAFNSGSPVTVDFGGSDDTAKAVKITSENKIVVAGQTNSSESGGGIDRDFVLVVLEQNGAFDNSFSTDGKVEIDIADTEDNVADVQVTDDNDFVIIGETYVSSYYKMTAVKYNDTGTLVSGFGTSGILSVDISLNTRPRSSIIDTEGYIYVVGDSTASSDDFFILRLDESGHDTSFSSASSGVLRHDDGGAEEANDLAFDKDGNIIVAGKKDNIVAVWAFALSGTTSETASKLSSFNNNTGIYSLDFPSTTTDEAFSLVSDKRGNFYVAAKADAGTRVIKLSADGKIDTTYHGLGFKTVSLNSGINNTITRAALDAYGQLLIVDVEDPSTTDDQVQITYDFITQAPTFGTCESAQEYVSTTSGKTTDYANHADLASDGKGVFVVGTSTSLVDSVADLTVIKTDITGNIDSSWGTYGSKRISELTELVSAFSQEVIATNNGEVVIAATESDETGIILVKLDSFGDLNTSFNSTGIRDISSTAEIQVRGTAHNAATDDFYVVGETVTGSTQIYRFNSDGTDDLTFGMGVSTSSLDSGKNYTEITDSNFQSHDMVIDSSGDIYIAGSFNDGSKKRVAFVKMNQNGFIDYSGSWLITENDTTERVGISIAASNNELFILARDASNVAYVYNYSFAGALDTTFNGTGKLTLTGFVAITTSQFQIAVDSAQRPWLSVEDSSNNAFIISLNATDANFNSTFVNGGKAPLYNGISAWGTNTGFRGFLLDGSDNALLYGYDNNPIDFDVALAGMTSSGQLNSSVNHTYYDFGDGERAFAMVLDEYSSPILAGQSYNRTNNDQDYALTRFDNSGNSQANFATAGAGALQSNSIGVQDANTLLTLGGPSDDGYSDIQIATSGHLFMAGDTTPISNANNKNMTVLGTDPGSADLNDTLGYNIANVDISGSASNDKISDSYLADDGSLYVVGTASTTAFIAKVLKGGGLDSSFGSSGVTEFSAGTQTHFNAITSDGKGRLIAVGFVENSSFDGLIVRFNTDGSLDTTFSSGDGTNGYDAFDGTVCEEDYFSVGVGADGTIYVGGQESSNALIVAYNSDGTLNTGFNSSGFLSLNYGSTIDFDEGFDDIKVDQFGGIMALAVISSTNQFTLSRFKPDGTKLRDYSGMHSPGTITQMHALEIDVLGNVFVTGEIQHDQIWKFYVVRFPNAVGPLL